MYDEPYSDLVNRELKDDEYHNYLQNSSQILDSIVNFGSYLFKWAKEDEQVSNDEKIVSLVLLRKILDLLDSISLLISKSCVDSSKILLRSLLEILFETEYLLKQDTELRSKCLMVWYINNNINIKEQYNPTTKQGEIKFEKLKLDKMFQESSFSNFEQFSTEISDRIEKEILELKQILEGYPAIQEEYDKLKAKERAHWYSMYDGPKNAYQLASEVGMEGMYEFLFRQLSTTTHSNDFFEGVFRHQEGENAIKIIQIRAPKDISFTVSLTITFALQFYRNYIDYFFPDSKFALEQYREWYKTSIREFYLTRVEIVKDQ